MNAYAGILNAYMGAPPSDFEYEGKEYTPLELAKELGLASENYASLTSFNHHPFNSNFILEVPDNWSNGSFYNLPIDDLMNVLDEALENGFTVAWDADVSEKTWSRKNDIAKWPASSWKELNKEQKNEVFNGNIEEAEVDQEMRQKAFENLSTTDDHLMHIVGTAKDQYGNNYYIVKNSWGEDRPHDGFVYVSEAYMRMKTISFTLHKDGLDKKLRKAIQG
jgi:bleomycin hydrolase